MNPPRFVLEKVPGFILVCGLFLFSCSNSAPEQNNVAVSQSEKDNSRDQPSKETKETQKKSDAEQTVEIVNIAVDVGKDLIRNKRIRDSIMMTKKEKMYAYQLGLPVTDLEVVFDLYGSLDSKESVYILKRSRHDYYIIKYDGRTENELKDSLEAFRKTIPSSLAAGTKVIDVALLCDRKEKPKFGKNITKRRHDEELPCLLCENE